MARIWVLFFSLLNGLVRGMQYTSLGNGTFVRTVGEGCTIQRMGVGVGTKVLIQSEGFQSGGYKEKLNCLNLFKAEGECSLLLKCSDFQLQNPRAKDNKCVRDFMFIRSKGLYKGKHCGQDMELRDSRNVGSKLTLKFRTNKDGIKDQGFSCQVTCCPNADITSTVIDSKTGKPGRRAAMKWAGKKQDKIGRKSKTASHQNGSLPRVQQCSGDAEQQQPKCGIKGGLENIVGGQATEKNEFTWMSLLTTSDSRILSQITRKMRRKFRNVDIGGLPREHVPFCGGTLISKDWIITAAHCTLQVDGQYRPDRYLVVLGEWDRKQEGDTIVHVHKLSQQLKHPAYNTRTFDNDIALWKLDTPADLNLFRVVCLPVPGTRVRNPLTVAGWGVMKEGSNAVANVLQKVDVAAVSRSTCVRAMDPYEITENMLCAGGQEGKDSCQGDSGGPLMGENADQAGQMMLVGVVSWGLGCAREGLYGVYTKVSNYEQWITDTTK